MEHADAMKKPRMSGTGIDKIRKAELFDTSKPLERARLNDLPKHVFHLRHFDVELDKVVQWVANALLLGHSSESPGEEKLLS